MLYFVVLAMFIRDLFMYMLQVFFLLFLTFDLNALIISVHTPSWKFRLKIRVLILVKISVMCAYFDFYLGVDNF